MLMEVLEQQPAVRSGWQRSLRFQMSAALLFGALLPTLFYRIFVVPGAFTTITGHISLGAAIIAAATCVMLLRQLSAFPGIRPASQVVPIQAIVYGTIIAVILVLRLPYSIAILLLCFTCTLVTLFVLGVLSGRVGGKSFCVVAGGRVERLCDLPGFRYAQWDAADGLPPANAIVVADLRHDHSAETQHMLAEATLQGIPVCHFKQIWEAATGRVLFDHLSENSFGSLLPSLSYRKVKRLFDLSICALSLPFALIPMALIAIAIKIDSPGPALFRQTRLGYRGRVFDVVKFRTMEHRRAENGDEAERQVAITSSEDPRVTRIGRFLRRTRLDELPQIWNVLRGEMSWIGPRPEAIALANWYQDEIPFYSYRHIVRPGITGWAQVNQGHVTELDEIACRLQLDLFYIKTASLWLDLIILIRTPSAILHGVRSFGLSNANSELRPKRDHATTGAFLSTG